jgi:hypothetical protein
MVVSRWNGSFDLANTKEITALVFARDSQSTTKAVSAIFGRNSFRIVEEFVAYARTGTIN